MNRMAHSVIEAFRERLAYDFSCLMSDFPQEVADEIYQWGIDNIPDEDLAENGREPHIHVTVKYGIHISDPTKVRDHLLNQKPIKARLGKVSLFDTSDEHDVVKIDVDSPQLHELNGIISGNFETTDTFPDYKPHVTIAYVKKGLGKKYNGRNDFEGRMVKLNSAIFSGKDNRETTLNFPR